MKKYIACFLLCSLFLTSCSKESTDSISFEPSFNTNTSLSEAKQPELFASDLCVIKEEEQDTADTVMKSSASLIVNRTENKVIYAKNVYDKLYPASLTKIVTALVALKEGNKDDTVTVSYNASHITESGAKLCGFREGDEINFTTLLNSLLIYSGNDAGIALAEHLAGSEEAFATMMNEEVMTLGATHSNFVNAHGLHNENHYTTVYDIYLIFNELLNYSEFKDMINQTSYKAEYKTREGKEIAKIFQNTNGYLIGNYKAPNDITVLGGKTGTTNAAGNCLVLLSTDQSGNEYISIVLNASSKNELYKEMSHLLSMIE